MSKNFFVVFIILTIVFVNLPNWIEERQTALLIRNAMIILESFFLLFLIIRKYKKNRIESK
jgi:hypothetical protein